MLLEQLKGIVWDIHNAIGEGWPLGSGGFQGLGRALPLLWALGEQEDLCTLLF